MNNISLRTLDDSRKQQLQSWMPAIGALFIIIFFAIVTNNRILSRTNLISILNQCFTLVIAAVGGTFVYSHGGMDMSIGAVECLLVWIGVQVINSAGWFVGLLVILACGAMCGFITGGTHVAFGIPAFITSMCMQYICRGIVTTAVANNILRVDSSFYAFNNWGLKITVMVIVVAIGAILFEKTRLGKSLKAIGGNGVAASYNGINTKRAVVSSYMILGFCMGICAFFAISREGAASSNTGAGLELDMMLAVVLGGLPLSGGAAAHMSCAVLGSLIITILGNGLVLWGLPVEAVQGIKGVLLLLVVMITYDRGQVNRGFF